MLNFELSMIDAGATVKDAIAETIESGKSGLLVQTNTGSLHLVHYDRLVEAEASGAESLAEVQFEPVLEITSVAGHQIADLVRSAGLVFGFLGMSGAMARLFSLSEGKGGPYASASSGGRCHRPNKPPNVLPRDWYHYYPTIPSPNVCAYDSSAIS